MKPSNFPVSVFCFACFLTLCFPLMTGNDYPEDFSPEVILKDDTTPVQMKRLRK